jgi:tetratricopeptide (TPR) repeat protein
MHQIVQHFADRGGVPDLHGTTGEQLVQFAMPFDSRSSVKACLSPDGKQLATSMSETFSLGARGAGIVEVWDVASRTVMFTLHGHTMPVGSIAFSPDGRRIVTGSGRVIGGQASSGETMLWDAQTGQELMRLGDGTGNLTFTPDGRQLFGDNADLASTNTFQLWDASPLEPEREAALLVEAFLSKPSGQSLPLKSEAFARIDADASLSESVRAAARQKLRAIRRSASELNQAGWRVVRMPGQTRNDYERALRYLEEALDTDPTNRESWSNRALAHYRLDQSSEALAALARSQELHVAQNFPLPAEDLTILAMTQHQSGRHDEARRSLDKAQAAASRNEPAWRKLFTEAETLLAVASQSDAAQRWIGRKVMHRPKAGWDVLPIVVSKAEGNLLFTGSRWIEKSQVVPLEHAEAYYTHLLQLEPGNAWAHNLRGFVRGQQGDRDKELEDYNEAIRHSPGGDQGISAFRNRGQWWERKGNVEYALRDYQEVIRLDPQDRSAFYRRAGLLQRSGKLDEALKDYDETIRIDPNYAGAYANRGFVWRMKGNLENALKDFDEAIRLNAKTESYFANRGLAWQQKGDPDRAIQDYDEAIRLNPKYGTAHSYRVGVHQHLGNRDKAIADLQQVIELTPGPAAAPYYRTRGDMHLSAQEHNLAILDYTEAIRLTPENAGAHNNLAWLLATCPEQGIRDGKKSVEHATKACELEKWQSPISLDTLAAAYAETGNFAEAIKYQEQSLTLARTDAQKAEGESHLALYREGKPYHEMPKAKAAAD